MSTEALLEQILAVLRAGQRPQSSVELVRTARGVAWTVKVYGDDPQAAKDEAVRLFEELAATYDYGSGA
jgi:hypothetical protein